MLPLYLVSQLWLYLENSQVSIYRTIGPLVAYAKTKIQISFPVTAKLISAFIFATYTVQSLYFLNTKFQASSYLQWLYSPVCVEPGRKPRRPVFSQQGSYCAAFLFPIICICHLQLLLIDLMPVLSVYLPKKI